MVDITDILVYLILLAAALLGVGGGWLWKNKIRPWLEQHKLEKLMDMLPQLAKIAAMAAEVAWGRGNGAEKWQMALSKLAEYGFAVDDQRVYDALTAAWKQLDLMQLMAGEKEKPPEETQE